MVGYESATEVAAVTSWFLGGCMLMSDDVAARCTTTARRAPQRRSRSQDFLRGCMLMPCSVVAKCTPTGRRAPQRWLR